MTEAPRPWRRRAVITGSLLAVAGWVIGAPRLASLWPARLAYRDLPGLAPFRELETAGALSNSTGLLVGLDESAPPDAAQDARMIAVRADPCTALFGRQTDSLLPIGFFSDFNCPNCWVLDAILLDYDAGHPGTIRIIRHELPLLGAASTIASQAVLAADRQGGYQAMHDRLLRTRKVGETRHRCAAGSRFAAERRKWRPQYALLGKQAPPSRGLVWALRCHLANSPSLKPLSVIWRGRLE